jgi:hypothetical protein
MGPTGDPASARSWTSSCLTVSADSSVSAGRTAQNVLLGRGDHEMEKFMRFGIQRPGEPFAPSPRPGRELFAGTRADLHVGSKEPAVAKLCSPH